MKTTDQLIHSAYADLTSCATIESLEKLELSILGKMDLLPNYLNSSHLSLLKREKEVGKNLTHLNQIFLFDLKKLNLI